MIFCQMTKQTKHLTRSTGNITGVEWEAEMEIQDPATNIPQINNKQYAALVDEEDNEGNDNESTGVDNDGKTTGV